MSADFWAGYVSGAVGILIGNPLDLVKVRLQAGSPSPTLVSSASSAFSASASPTSSTAASRLYRRTAALATGSAAPILGYGALNALLFVSYRKAEVLLSASPLGPSSDGAASAGTRSSPAVAWAAGAVAGLATWIVSTPTELIKCRAQVAPAAHAAAPSSWLIARQVWAREGLRGFFLGGTVTALRDSIGYGFYFWSYQLMTEAWRARASGSDSNSTSSSGTDIPSPIATLLCGGLAGIVTWASVFPLDVIKTRVQAQALAPPSVAHEQTPLLSAPARLSTLQITRQAYREGGLAVFFRGLGVCSARAFVVNAAQWAVYEWMMRRLGAQPGVSQGNAVDI